MASVTTRAELRYRAARKIGDAWVATATAVGTTTTLIDLDHLSYQNNYFKGREAIAISGTAANIVSGTGLIRRIDASTGSTGTITFGRALTAATAVGDVYHIFNYRDNGLYISDWNGFIDEAIDAVRDTFLREAVSSNKAFVESAPVISLNSALTLTGVSETAADLWGVFGADIKDSSGIWHKTKRSDLRVDRASRTIELLSRTRQSADGLDVRIRGYLQTTLLTTDSATTSADPEYVASYAASRALMILARRLGPEGTMAIQEAERHFAVSEQRKASCRTRLRSGVRRL